MNINGNLKWNIETKSELNRFSNRKSRSKFRIAFRKKVSLRYPIFYAAIDVGSLKKMKLNILAEATKCYTGIKLGFLWVVVSHLFKNEINFCALFEV